MTPVDLRSGFAASGYRLFQRVHKQGARDFFGRTNLTIQGRFFRTWTSLKEPRPGHKRLNIKGENWTFSFVAYVSENGRYNDAEIAKFSAHAFVCRESPYPVMVYDFAVSNTEAFKKELVLLRMFDEVNDRPLAGLPPE